MNLVKPPVWGTFVRELKNRFLCEVVIDGETIECYVPSSCRLGNFIDLQGKRVLLLPTEASNARTKLALFAVPYKHNYILLNISKVNKLIEDNINRRYFSSLGRRSKIFREHQIGSYKSDLYIAESQTMLEVKSILSLEQSALFPTVYSQRTLNQLKEISKLIDDGYNAALIIVSLNPYVKNIKIDYSSPFYLALMDCVNKGMQVIAVSLYTHTDMIKIKKRIDIEF